MPPRRGVTWTPDAGAARTLIAWLRSLPPAPVQGTADQAEEALTRAAIAAVPALDDAKLQALAAELAPYARTAPDRAGTRYDALHGAILDERRRRGSSG